MMSRLFCVERGLSLARRAALIAVLIVSICAPVSAQDRAVSKQDARPKLPITITSDAMEASKGNGNVVFKGNVVAVEDFTLCSDELFISYGKEKEIREMLATGSVRIFYADRTAVATKAEYDREKKTLVLIGNAEVRQCSDVVRGDRIVVHIDDENAMVQSESGGRVKAVIMPAKKCPQPVGIAAAGAVRDVTIEEARCRGSR